MVNPDYRFCLGLRLECRSFGKLYLRTDKQTFFTEWSYRHLPKENGYDYASIVNRIYFLESDYGQEDRCQKIGLHNGYGLAESATKETCFSSHALAEQLTENWFKRELQTMSLSSAVCYYNTGIIENDCPYYQKYLTIK